MPFKSEKQRRLLWAKHPEIASRWAKEYPDSNRDLPLYADQKVKSKKLNKSETKEAHMTTVQAILRPLLARFAPPREPLAKQSNSILERVQVPQTGRPTYANQTATEEEGTGPNPIDNDEGQAKEMTAGTNGLQELLCSKIAKEEKGKELAQIQQILRKKAMVPAKQFREIIDRMLAGANMGMQRAKEPQHVPGNRSEQYGNRAGSVPGLGAGGIGQGTQGNAPGAQANGQGTQGNGTGEANAIGPAPPQGSPAPNNVGEGYGAFLRSVNNQITQSRMNAMVPPPMGSQAQPQAPAVVAAYPGMNSAPAKTASNLAGSSLGPALKAIQPVSGQFQASNIANKGKNMFSTGNDALLNTIGKLSPFKTKDGKTDITAGISGGAYGNLPNTPKTNQLG